MNNLKRENISDSSSYCTDKHEEDRKHVRDSLKNNTKEIKEGSFDKEFKDSKEELVDDEVQLRKHSRAYKSLIRNRKVPIPTTMIPSTSATTLSPQTTSSGRSKSLSWYRTNSLLQPQFGSNLFSRKGSKNQRKFSAPINLSLSRNQQRKR